MALHQGYNIVTEPVTDTDNELTALEFFRKLAADQPVECPVTVTGLDELLYNATEDSRSDIIRELQQVLRRTRSVQSMDAVQFCVEGSIMDDAAFRIRIERSHGGVYLNVGQLFVEKPKPISATHYVARK